MALPDEKETVAEEQAWSILARKDYLLAKYGVDNDSSTDQEERYQLYLGRSSTPVATVKFQMHKALKKQLKKECESVWSQIEKHSEARAKGGVDTLVLTGGMTKNAFVRDWFEQKVSRSGTTTTPIGKIVFLSDPELSVSKGLVHDALESYKRDGLWMYKSLHSYGIVVYNSCGNVETKKEFIAKGQVIDPKKFETKQTIRLKLADNVSADLRFARWDNENSNVDGNDNDNDSDNDDDGINTVGFLTKELPTSTEWEVRVLACSHLTLRGGLT
ncbi:hypothetical protein N0V92_013602 [Colletotrichum tropicale]|nr:hypothetical protein N0V92_013602 [Colletotrichum tropicale]